MAHELDFSKGFAALAIRGEAAWHRHGNAIEEGDDLATIAKKGGMDYSVIKSPVMFRQGSGTIVANPDAFQLYRDDNDAPLSIVSSRYNVVQPAEIMETYRELVETLGYSIETAGVLKGGRKVWALANAKDAIMLPGGDAVKNFLLLATSYDGSMATQARWTQVRVVCDNTIQAATMGQDADVYVSHSTKFDAEAVKLKLQIGNGWETFSAEAKRMTEREITKDETIKLFMDIYFGLTTVDEIQAFHEVPKQAESVEKFMKRMTTALFESPGAHMASARGTLWGALNAVTFDVDYQLPSRSADSRLDKAWFGTGNALKQKAWNKALAMVA